MANNQIVKDEKGSTTLFLNQNEEVAKLAYQFFVERGGEHGHDFEDWLKAEASLQQPKKSKLKRKGGPSGDMT